MSALSPARPVHVTSPSPSSPICTSRWTGAAGAAVSSTSSSSIRDGPALELGPAVSCRCILTEAGAAPAAELGRLAATAAIGAVGEDGGVQRSMLSAWVPPAPLFAAIELMGGGARVGDEGGVIRSMTMAAIAPCSSSREEGERAERPWRRGGFLALALRTF